MDIEKLLAELHLSPSQYQQLKALFAEYSDKMDEVFAFEGDRKSMWKQMRCLLKSKEQHVQSVLTQQQNIVYQQMRKQERFSRKLVN